MKKLKLLSIFLLLGVLTFSLFSPACDTNNHESGSTSDTSDKEMTEPATIPCQKAEIQPYPYNTEGLSSFYSLIDNSTKIHSGFSVNDYALGDKSLASLYPENFFQEKALVYYWAYIRSDAAYEFSGIYRENNQLIIQIDLYVEEYKTEYTEGVAQIMYEVNKQDIQGCESVKHKITWHIVEMSDVDC